MAGLTRLSGVSRSYSHIRLHVRRRQRGNHRLRNPRFPRLPTSLIFSRAEVKWGNQVTSCPWPDTGGAAWLAFGPCRNSWLRARHRRKYLQFPQPPPNSSLLHRCQDISSLHLPHGVQKNDTPNRPGGCIGCFHLGPIPPWLACPVALPRRTATFLLHAPPVGDHLDSSLDWSRQGSAHKTSTYVNSLDSKNRELQWKRDVRPWHSGKPVSAVCIPPLHCWPKQHPTTTSEARIICRAVSSAW